MLENVVVDERGVLDLDDDSKTENTRAAYKLEQIANALPAKQAGHPSSVVMLTADAFGILPPIARLSREQAMFYFLSGYTAKVAGTEIGVTEPQATFSTCFGAPFLPQPPAVYARMLGEKLDAHPHATVWLVNTGWTGGPFGEGSACRSRRRGRCSRAALEEGLTSVEYRTDPVFGFEVPVRCRASTRRCSTRARPGRDPDAYDRKAAELARMFLDNFAARFGDIVDDARPPQGPTRDADAPWRVAIISQIRGRRRATRSIVRALGHEPVVAPRVRGPGSIDSPRARAFRRGTSCSRRRRSSTSSSRRTGGSLAPTAARVRASTSRSAPRSRGAFPPDALAVPRLESSTGTRPCLPRYRGPIPDGAGRSATARPRSA